MRAWVATVVIALAIAAAGAAWWVHSPQSQPTAIVLAGAKTDTIEGVNGADPIAPALVALGYRVYSLDLPCHFTGMTENGLECWSKRIADGEDTLLSDVCRSVSAIIDEAGASRVQLVGISRGGFVAFECGAVDDRVTDIAQIAPVVDLSALREFSGVALDPAHFDLAKYADALRKRKVLIRIGDRDERVSTAMVVALGEKIGAEIELLDVDGHRAPDPDNVMAKWLLDRWNSPH